ncbi:MAG: FAD-dependent oxidoreductase [bacterium]|nr:FAD-dependent oxidoreductase [bacterium]
MEAGDTKIVLRERKEVADGTTVFWFEVPAEFSFHAGQWVDITLMNPKYRDDGGVTRTLSIASSPHDKEKFMIVIRNGKSAFKRNLRDLAIGAEVRLTGIGGSFVLPEKSDRPIIMIAGGIGIAPMRGMIEWATHEKLSHRIALFYSNRTAGESAFLNELRAWENENFKLIATLTEGFDPTWKGERGRIDEKMVAKYAPDFSTARFYIAGPPAMVAATWQMLVAMGVDDGAIKTEEFSGY